MKTENDGNETQSSEKPQIRKHELHLDNKIVKISNMERKILKLFVLKHTCKQIAETIGWHYRSVECTIRDRVMMRLNCHRMAELIEIIDNDKEFKQLLLEID